MYFCKLIFTTALLLLTVAESLDTTASSTSQCCCKVCKCDTREEKNLPDPYLERLLRERRKSIDEQLTSLRTSNTQPQADQWNSESNMNSQQLEENIAESAQLEAEHYDEPQYGEASAKELEINANSVDIIKTPKEEQPKMERKINQPLRPSPEAKGYQQNSLVNENSDYDEFRGRIFRRRKHRNRNRNRNKNSKNSKKSPIITKRKRMLPNEVANKRSSEDNFDNHIHSRESDHNWSSVSRQLVSDELGSARRRRAAFENQMEKKTVGNGEQDKSQVLEAVSPFSNSPRTLQDMKHHREYFSNNVDEKRHPALNNEHRMMYQRSLNIPSHHIQRRVMPSPNYSHSNKHLNIPEDNENMDMVALDYNENPIYNHKTIPNFEDEGRVYESVGNSKNSKYSGLTRNKKYLESDFKENELRQQTFNSNDDRQQNEYENSRNSVASNEEAGYQSQNAYNNKYTSKESQYSRKSKFNKPRRPKQNPNHNKRVDKDLDSQFENKKSFEESQPYWDPSYPSLGNINDNSFNDRDNEQYKVEWPTALFDSRTRAWLEAFGFKKKNNKNSTIPQSGNSLNPSSNVTDEYRRKIALHFRNEILQCKAFSSLEDFLNSLPKNETSNANREEETEEINEEFSTRNIHEFMTENPEFHITTKRSNNTLSKSHEELDVPPTKWPSTNDSHNDDDYEDEEEYYEDIDFGNTTATDASKIDPETITKDLPVVSKDSFLSDRDTNYKLNISINAKVNGNTTNKMFYGNGSICVNPAYEVDRSAQHSDLASLEHGEEYRSFVDNMKTMQSNPKEKANPLDVTPDKLSSNIVEKVFQSVRDHPQLKVLWPSLKNNQLPERTHMPRFNALRNQDNEQHIQHSEQLMREALNILNNAIDQKFQTKSCVPLSSDLREFYNLILRTNEEQRREREKRQVEWGKLRKEDDENSKIYNNGKVVNKNDGQWEENSLMDLQNEDGVDVKLRRELWNRKYLGTNLNDLELLEQLYSSEFSKLLKACELYREISKVFGRKDNLNL
uniref:Uncharacterized protein n=2 Tax=Stomoxys calcitrans TaxID=35570 RepID=A0A1I8Q8P8_STOCA